MTLRGVVALACLLIAGGCALTPPRAAPWPDRDEPALRALTDWQASGRLGVKSEESGFAAHFDWHESATGSRVDVRGPMGLGAVRITRTDEMIVIDNGRGVPQSVAAPFEALEGALAERLGAPLPLAPLRYWLLGIPDPAAPTERTAPDRFLQYGWAVTVAEPATVPGAPSVLPRELTLERPPTRIRVILEDWHIGSPAGAVAQGSP